METITNQESGVPDRGVPPQLERLLEPDVLERLKGHVSFLRDHGYPGVDLAQPETVIAAYTAFASTYDPKVPGYTPPFPPERNIHHEADAPRLIEADMAELERALGKR